MDDGTGAGANETTSNERTKGRRVYTYSRGSREALTRREEKHGVPEGGGEGWKEKERTDYIVIREEC